MGGGQGIFFKDGGPVWKLEASLFLDPTEVFFFLFVCLFVFVFSGATLAAYGGSQARV